MARKNPLKRPPKSYVEEHYVNGNKTLAEIALEFDIAPAYMSAIIRKYGIEAKPSPKKGKVYGHVVHSHIDPAEVKQMYLSKRMSMDAIGDCFGCSAPTIASILNDIGVKRRHHNDTKRGRPANNRKVVEVERVILQYSKKHQSKKSVANYFKVSESTIALILKEEGVKAKPNKMSVNKFGENNPNYKPELTQEDRDKVRRNYDQSNWREKVFARDRYTCQCCGYDKGGNLQAHHIIPHSINKAVRWDLSNGVTLCSPCHNKYHRSYKIKSCNPETLCEFIKANNS